MYHLVYMSSTATPIHRSTLDIILKVSREKNAQLGLTGMLLYADQVFLQLLEGSHEAVFSVYERIAKDPRHKNPIKLLELETSQRVCANWTMAYEDLKPEDLPGYDPSKITYEGILDYYGNQPIILFGVFMHFIEEHGGWES